MFLLDIYKIVVKTYKAFQTFSFLFTSLQVSIYFLLMLCIVSRPSFTHWRKRKKKKVPVERGRMTTNWFSHKALKCSDSSKHDAISACYCYSLNPYIIRHCNTTIMQGATLTSSQLPAASATVWTQRNHKKMWPITPNALTAFNVLTLGDICFLI